MGEYAHRVSDGAEIKIGTCESMYYLRFEDRHKVRAIEGNVNPRNDREAGTLLFRVPFLDEDGLQPGEYKDYNRGLRLYKTPPCRFCEGKPTIYECVHCHGSGKDWAEDFQDPDLLNHPGTIQLTHACGLLLNVPCYHGIELPKLGEHSAFWNGKSWFLELAHVRPVMENGSLRVYPVVHCRFCREAWRYQWADLWDYIPEDIRPRFEQYRQAAQVA